MLFRKKDNAAAVKEKATLLAKSAKQHADDTKQEKTTKGNTRTTVAVQKSSSIKAGIASGSANVNVLIRPRITEKATDLSGRSVYVFDVLPATTKNEIEKAFKELYKITPVKVAVLSIPSKKVFRRGTWGHVAGGKKAYVFLKKGEVIEIV